MTPNTDDHAAKLIARFPRLFKGHIPELGISTGAGWNALLVALFGEIDDLLDDSEAGLFRVKQIKQKFGGLRVYYAIGGKSDMVIDLVSPEGVASMRISPPLASGFPREDVDRLIEEAASLAQETCEHCGRPGRIRTNGWIRVLCDSCQRN